MSSSARALPPSVLVAARLVSFGVICGVLYLGQVVLIPIALAVLLAFVLSPAVTRFQRIGLPRVAAVILVVACTGATLVGLGWVVAGELNTLAAELPAYRSNIRAKVADVRKFASGGTLEKVQATIEGIGADLERGAGPAGDDPTLVELVPDRSLLGDVERFLPALESATTFGLALLLSILMLIEREDVRNRIVSLAGHASLVTTTKAFAEAGQRISRYLLMQLIINAATGLAVWLGLYLIGVPYAVLWGLIAAVLRYVPYVGIWIAALFPITLSLVITPDWTDVAMVFGLFLALELLVGNFIEPWLYGHSVGLSPIAVILAVIFWTWIWGAVGLVLATPLTVCLVVIGKYISGFAIFGRLLGVGSSLEPHLWLYQRLLARDEKEAAEVLEEFAAEHTLEATCEQLLLPALLKLKRDVANGQIDAVESAFVAEALGEIVTELPRAKAADEKAPDVPPRSHRVLFVGFPPQNRFDEVALALLGALLRDEPRCELTILSVEQLVGERIAAVEAQPPDAVCIPSLPPGDLAATRVACKRLRAALPRVPIIVARFADPALQKRAVPSLIEAGASTVTDTLGGLRAALAGIVTTAASLPRAESDVAPLARATSVAT